MHNNSHTFHKEMSHYLHKTSDKRCLHNAIVCTFYVNFYHPNQSKSFTRNRPFQVLKKIRLWSIQIKSSAESKMALWCSFCADNYYPALAKNSCMCMFLSIVVTSFRWNTDCRIWSSAVRLYCQWLQQLLHYLRSCSKESFPCHFIFWFLLLRM